MDYTDVIEKALQACEAYLFYAPYSRFCVGACLKMKDGSYICGANVVECILWLNQLCRTQCSLVCGIFSRISQAGY